MASRPLRPGDPRRLGDYQLIARLGEGGMGTVYLGRDAAGRPVAVKSIRREYADHEEFRARFRSEVNRVRQVPSFCTAAVLDADPDHQTPYLVVEYVDGPSLSEVVTEQGPISGGDLHSVALGVGAALTAIHGAGVIHRDLKPTNVLLSLGLPKVIDFGLAQALEVTSRHTRTDHVVGTVAYLAPERLDPALGPVTQAADIFAWGAVVAYAGTGRIPFGGDTPMATAARILTMPPDLNGLPKPLIGLVTRALSKDPQERPTANDVVQELLTASRPKTRAAAGPAGWKDFADYDRPAQGHSAQDHPARPARGRATPERPARDQPGRGRPRHGRPEDDEPDNGRFDPRELLEQLIAEGPKPPGQAPPTRIPPPRRSHAAAPVGPSPGRNSRTTTPPSPGRNSRVTSSAAGGLVQRLLAAVRKQPLVAGLLALAVVAGAAATFVWAGGDEPPAAAPPPAAATSAAARTDALDARGPSLFDPLDAPRRFQAGSDESGSCAFADAQLRARTTGTATHLCRSPEDVFAGDQSIVVDVTLAVADSCAMVWFRYDGNRGYQLAACTDRLEMAQVGGAIVKSIGKAQSATLRPGTRHQLSITVAGPYATVAIDGATVIQGAVADPNLAAGRIVLGVTGTRATTAAEARFADLEVRAS